jgi:hypothetical protein
MVSELYLASRGLLKRAKNDRSDPKHAGFTKYDGIARFDAARMRVCHRARPAERLSSERQKDIAISLRQCWQTADDL